MAKNQTYVALLLLLVLIVNTNAISPPRRIRMCHMQTNAIHCYGKMIEINEAMYGRRHTEYCSFSTVTDCEFDATGSVKQLCEGKEYCQLQANPRHYNDMCPMVDKYLEVNYSCV